MKLAYSKKKSKKKIVLKYTNKLHENAFNFPVSLSSHALTQSRVNKYINAILSKIKNKIRTFTIT